MARAVPKLHEETSGIIVWDSLHTGLTASGFPSRSCSFTKIIPTISHSCIIGRCLHTPLNKTRVRLRTRHVWANSAMGTVSAPAALLSSVHLVHRGWKPSGTPWFFNLWQEWNEWNEWKKWNEWKEWNVFHKSRKSALLLLSLMTISLQPGRAPQTASQCPNSWTQRWPLHSCRNWHDMAVTRCDTFSVCSFKKGSIPLRKGTGQVREREGGRGREREGEGCSTEGMFVFCTQLNPQALSMHSSAGWDLFDSGYPVALPDLPQQTKDDLRWLHWPASLAGHRCASSHHTPLLNHSGSGSNSPCRMGCQDVSSTFSMTSPFETLIFQCYFFNVISRRSTQLHAWVALNSLAWGVRP